MKIKAISPDLKAQVFDYPSDNVVVVVTTISNPRVKHDLFLAFSECFTGRKVMVVDTDEVTNLIVLDQEDNVVEDFKL